jgi:hypothetical protein
VRIILALVLAVGVAAAAPPSQEELARSHFVAGQQEYARGRWGEALHEFQLGYALSPRPEFLINFAQAYRKLGDYERATAECERYLATAPPPALAAQAERLLSQLREEQARASAKTEKLAPVEATGHPLGQTPELHAAAAAHPGANPPTAHPAANPPTALAPTAANPPTALAPTGANPPTAPAAAAHPGANPPTALAPTAHPGANPPTALAPTGANPPTALAPTAPVAAPAASLTSAPSAALVAPAPAPHRRRWIAPVVAVAAVVVAAAVVGVAVGLTVGQPDAYRPTSLGTVDFR